SPGLSIRLKNALVPDVAYESEGMQLRGWYQVFSRCLNNRFWQGCPHLCETLTHPRCRFPTRGCWSVLHRRPRVLPATAGHDAGPASGGWLHLECCGESRPTPRQHGHVPANRANQEMLSAFPAVAEMLPLPHEASRQ